MEMNFLSLKRASLSVRFQERRVNKKFMGLERRLENLLCFITQKELQRLWRKLRVDFMLWVEWNSILFYAKMFKKRARCANGF